MADISGMPHAIAKVHSVVQDIFERIEQLSGLGPDWDSYGGVPPSATAIEAARQFVSMVASSLGPQWGQAIRPYVVVPLRDGGVQIEWRTAAKEIELEVSADGTFGYLLIDNAGKERRFEEADDVSPSIAIELVRQVLAAS